MKKLILGLCALIASSNAFSDLSTGIESVAVDPTFSQITIKGNGLSSTGNTIVTLGGVRLPTVSQTATTLVVECPGSPAYCSPGDWSLQVSTYTNDTLPVPVGQETWDFTIGAVGPTGATGQAGPAGPKGATGATGAVGPQGPAGATGATGAVGSQGQAGATGAKGSAGPQGLTGPAGLQGPVGPQGPTGKDVTSTPAWTQLQQQVADLITNKNVICDPNTVLCRRLSVLSFTMPDQGFPAGQEWTPRYYHIKTPMKTLSENEWRYDLTGYAYGIGKPIKFTWVGFFYYKDPNGNIVGGACSDNTTNNIPCEQYKGSDGYLYLKFGPVIQFSNTFVLDFQGSSAKDNSLHTAQSYHVYVTVDGTHF